MMQGPRPRRSKDSVLHSSFTEPELEALARVGRRLQVWLDEGLIPEGEREETERMIEEAVRVLEGSAEAAGG